jgi:hypothetical protein
LNHRINILHCHLLKSCVGPVISQKNYNESFACFSKVNLSMKSTPFGSGGIFETFPSISSKVGRPICSCRWSKRILRRAPCVDSSGIRHIRQCDGANQQASCQSFHRRSAQYPTKSFSACLKSTTRLHPLDSKWTHRFKCFLPNHLLTECVAHLHLRLLSSFEQLLMTV